MKSISAISIAEIVSGRYVGPSDLILSAGCVFDSRKVKSGDIFLALKGEKLNGHDYIPDAFRSGAALTITTQPVDYPHIQVADVMTAIASLATSLRASLDQLRVIGITGSQGKTTTKDILNTILSSVAPTVAPENSFNNELGAPLTILNCSEMTRFCIVEMGARHSGDIARLTEIANPDVGVVLKVGTAHLGEFGSREKIAETKSELIKGLHSGATAVLGTYDEFTPIMATGLDLNVITFGEKAGCSVRAADIEMHGGYPNFDLVTPEGREPVALRMVGEHQIPNALAAAAAAVALGIPTTQIAAGLSSHEPKSKWRMELSEINDIVVINDSYNANPESMAAALRTLVLLSQERGGRTWAFLGSMHELGEESPKMHHEIGVLVGQLNIDHLVSINNQDYIDGCATSHTTVHPTSSISEASRYIHEIQPGDVVLIKASRAEALDQLAAAIIEGTKGDATT